MNALKNGSRFNLLPVEQFAQEMNRFFDGNLNRDLLASSASRSPVSIWENDTHFFLEMDLPGVPREDIELKVVDNHLVIKANRPAVLEPCEQEAKCLLQERSFGDLERTFKMPSKISDSEVEACLTDGVLKVSLTKAPESQVKKIEIKTA